MLTINVSELIFTVLGFFVLMFLLNKLLFQPVIAFREQRQQEIDGSFARQAKAREEKESLEDQIQAQRSESLRKAHELLEQAQLKGQDEALERVHQLEQERLDKVDKAIADSSALREKSLEETKGESLELAQLLAQRLSR